MAPGWSRYSRQDRRGRFQATSRQSASRAIRHSVGAHIWDEPHANYVESVWAMLMRSIPGTWYDLSSKIPKLYANESAFGPDECTREVDPIDRMTLIARGVGGKNQWSSGLVA